MTPSGGCLCHYSSFNQGCFHINGCSLILIMASDQQQPTEYNNKNIMACFLLG
jgi:hypothetical protein